MSYELIWKGGRAVECTGLASPRLVRLGRKNLNLFKLIYVLCLQNKK